MLQFVKTVSDCNLFYSGKLIQVFISSYDQVTTEMSYHFLL